MKKWIVEMPNNWSSLVPCDNCPNNIQLEINKFACQVADILKCPLSTAVEVEEAKGLDTTLN
jgi:hypothetical protein